MQFVSHYIQARMLDQPRGQILECSASLVAGHVQGVGCHLLFLLQDCVICSSCYLLCQAFVLCYVLGGGFHFRYLYFWGFLLHASNVKGFTSLCMSITFRTSELYLPSCTSVYYGYIYLQPVLPFTGLLTEVLQDIDNILVGPSISQSHSSGIAYITLIGH